MFIIRSSWRPQAAPKSWILAVMRKVLVSQGVWMTLWDMDSISFGWILHYYRNAGSHGVSVFKSVCVVYTCVCFCLCICMWRTEDRRHVRWLPQSHLVLFSRTESPTEPGACWVGYADWLVSCRDPAISVFQCWGYRCVLSRPSFPGCWGSKLSL